MGDSGVWLNAAKNMHDVVPTIQN